MKEHFPRGSGEVEGQSAPVIIERSFLALIIFLNEPLLDLGFVLRALEQSVLVSPKGCRKVLVRCDGRRRWFWFSFAVELGVV